MTQTQTTITQTQTQGSDIFTMESQPVDNIIWGRLYGKNIKIETIDLCDQTVTVGRGEECDIRLGKEVPMKFLCRFSKVHFKITRRNNDIFEPAYIQDFSRNGTFVNGEPIPVNERCILKNGDIIALVHPDYKIFEFRDFNPSMGQSLPNEITSVYFISNEIGRGSCGTVQLVYHGRTCVKYAMKKIHKNMLGTAVTVNVLNDPERIKNEVRIMKRLKHPCVLKMYDIVDKPDAVYMILEFMEGGTLLDRILEHRYLKEHVSKLFFYQMCLGVQYLHRKGITHRDLKPDNVLLQSTDEETLLKISDFGLSKFVNTSSGMKTLCGTPQYVAPEILNTVGEGAYTKKVDIWSLGVVLYSCLSGSLPFHGDDWHSIAQKIRKRTISFEGPIWRTVSHRAKNLIVSMLNLNPDERPSINMVLNHNWLKNSSVVQIAKRLMQQVADSSKEIDGSPIFEPPPKRRKIIVF